MKWECGRHLVAIPILHMKQQIVVMQEFCQSFKSSLEINAYLVILSYCGKAFYLQFSIMITSVHLVATPYDVPITTHQQAKASSTSEKVARKFTLDLTWICTQKNEKNEEGAFWYRKPKNVSTYLIKVDNLNDWISFLI